MSVSFPEAGGTEVSILLLLLMGFAVGVVGGFIGVGGGFLVTPALIALGFPGNVAAGTGISYVVGSAVIGTMRHRRLGNVDMKLGLLMVAGAMSGGEVGVRAVNWCKRQGVADEAVLVASLVVMLAVGTFTSIEALRSKRLMEEERERTGVRPRELVELGLAKKVQSINLWPMVFFPKAELRVSLWAVLAVGFVAGLLAGFVGVGGGFVKMPSLVYFLGFPSLIAVGTGLFEMMVSGSYVAIRHTMSSNVAIFAAFLMVLGASIGTQIGVLATRYASGPGVRLVLSGAAGLGAVGTAVKLAHVTIGGQSTAIELAAGVTIFGTMVMLVLIVFVIFALALIRQSGRPIPDWTRTLLVPRQYAEGTGTRSHPSRDTGSP